MASDEIVLDRESFKALAADSRVAILKKLAKRRMTGAELSEEMGFSPSTVKEHLDNLEKVGLVAKAHEGVERKWKYYELTSKGRRIVEPKGVPAQVWLVLGLAFIGLVFLFQVFGTQNQLASSASAPRQTPLQAPLFEAAKASSDSSGQQAGNVAEQQSPLAATDAKPACVWIETNSTRICRGTIGPACEMPKIQDPSPTGGEWCQCVEEENGTSCMALAS